MSTDGDVVREALDTIPGTPCSCPKHAYVLEAHAALARLEARIAEVESISFARETKAAAWQGRAEAAEARIAEQNERLMAYETPGWINSVQKVMEERRRAEAAEALCERYEKALREIKERDPYDLGYVQHVQLAAHRALAEEPHADVPGAGQRGC